MGPEAQDGKKMTCPSSHRDLGTDSRPASLVFLLRIPQNFSRHVGEWSPGPQKSSSGRPQLPIRKTFKQRLPQFPERFKQMLDTFPMSIPGNLINK